MKIAYFDCFSGISGDMIVGALLDAGLDFDALTGELAKLGLAGHSETADRVERGAITGTKFDVETDETGHGRTVAEILRLLDESSLDDEARATVADVVAEIGTAESHIHGRPLDELHLHETSGLDSIVDIVASVVGLRMLGVEAVFASKVHVGTGFVECAHGTLPVPAPATIALLEGIPVYSRGVEFELTTPTGAALIRVLAENFGVMPEMKVEAIGYGAGSRDLEMPNMLRVVLGETDGVPGETNGVANDIGRGVPHDADTIVLVETNLDDMNPEHFGHAADLLWKRGAVDVYLTPVFMKKNRPGTMITVLVPESRVDEVVDTLFEETTTLGVRISTVERRKLDREIVHVETEFGRIGVKVGRFGARVLSVAPEYEDCREAALANGVPLSDVYDRARESAREAVEVEEHTGS